MMLFLVKPNVSFGELLSLIMLLKSFWLCEMLMGVSLMLYYDVKVLQLHEICVLLEELNDERDITQQKDKLSKSGWSCY